MPHLSLVWEWTAISNWHEWRNQSSRLPYPILTAHTWLYDIVNRIDMLAIIKCRSLISELRCINGQKCCDDASWSPQVKMPPWRKSLLEFANEWTWWDFESSVCCRIYRILTKATPQGGCLHRSLESARCYGVLMSLAMRLVDNKPPTKSLGDQ